MTAMQGAEFMEDGGWYVSRRLRCGHLIQADENAGGFDEEPRVTRAMVKALLDFRVDIHDCERYEKEKAIRQEGKPFG